jgi:hypothetical protein
METLNQMQVHQFLRLAEVGCPSTKKEERKKVFFAE